MSDALAVNVTEPATVAPEDGEVIETVGGTVSGAEPPPKMSWPGAYPGSGDGNNGVVEVAVVDGVVVAATGATAGGLVCNDVGVEVPEFISARVSGPKKPVEGKS